MPYFGLLHKDGTLTDLSDSPLTARDGVKVVELDTLPTFPREIPMTYRAETRSAIPHMEFIHELQKQVWHMKNAEEDPKWQECCNMTSTVVATSESSDLQYPPDLVPQLLEKLAKDSQEAVKPINSECLRQILNVAYFASYTKEEGQDISFSLVILNLEDAEGMIPQPGWTPIQFTESRLFSVSEVAKLAPALDGSQSAIGIRIESDNTLRIWGILLTDRSPYKMKRGEANGCGFFGPPHLKLIVSNRSQLILEIMERRILEYRNGQIITNYLPVFTKDGHVFRYLQSRKISDNFPVRKPIHLLARRIMDMGHGGTLLVVDREEALHLQGTGTLKYKMSSNVDILRKICENIDMGETFFSHLDTKDRMNEKWSYMRRRTEDYYRTLDEKIDGIAKLAAVDGALAITTDLTVLAFGIRIECKKPDKVYKANDLFARQIEQVDMASLGTRHNSGAAFVNNFPKSLVFVASQDGVGTVFMKHRGNVVMWRPIEMDVLMELERMPISTPVSGEQSPTT